MFLFNNLNSLPLIKLILLSISFDFFWVSLVDDSFLHSSTNRLQILFDVDTFAVDPHRMALFCFLLFLCLVFMTNILLDGYEIDT